jgi:hypothetical protein
VLAWRLRRLAPDRLIAGKARFHANLPAFEIAMNFVPFVCFVVESSFLRPTDR